MIKFLIAQGIWWIGIAICPVILPVYIVLTIIALVYWIGDL